MNLPLSWLSEFVEPGVTPREYSDAMTMSGSKVEGFSYLGKEIEKVVVGRVLSIEKHPDADKLLIIKTDVGQPDPLTIVTGAQNLKEGDLVPVALDGALLPGDVHINRGTLRGVMSEGMLCSYQELGMSAGSFPGACDHGILVLTEGGKPGDDIRPIIGLDDTVVEFEITPNRPDCLSVIGLARETAATFNKPLRLHEPEVKGCGDGDRIENHLSARVDEPTLCARYTARVAKNIRIAPSPKWMRERLYAAGVRPINNIVDITNYVMLEYGQPMHAFDHACLENGEIIVRCAADGEKFITLDDQTRTLTGDMLVIADGKRPVGIAGVMGGQNTEITDSTRMIVFESANFSGASVRITAKKLGLRTEASARFEKGLDPDGTMIALNRACELVELLGAGDVVDGVIDVYPVPQPVRTLPLEAKKINNLIGMDLSEKQVAEYLTRLGFTVSGGTVSVPSWRADVEGMADLAEEAARFYGYDKIPVTLMTGESIPGMLTAEQKFERDLDMALRACGFDEVMTYSFISPKMYDKISLSPDSPLRTSLVLSNPLSEDMSIMRTTALPCILDAAARNFNYRNTAVRLFEMASVYSPALKEDGSADPEVQPKERKVLTLAAFGDGMDFYRFKGALETAFASLGICETEYVADSTRPSYHPGRCASVFSGDRAIGVLGQIHPIVQKNFSVDQALFAAEIDVEALYASRRPEARYMPLPKFPSVTRDLAVVCDESIPVGAMIRCIKENASDVLESVSLFDIYRGAQVPEGKKSVAFSLSLRDLAKTLTDTEADSTVAQVLSALKERFNAVLRG